VGATILFATLVYVTKPLYLTPAFLPTHEFVALTGVVRAGLALLAAAPVLAARRAPVRALGLILLLSIAASLFQQRTWPLQFAAGTLVGLIAVTRERRVSVLAALATLAVWLGQWLVSTLGNGVDYGQAFTLVLAVAVAWVVGHSIRQRRDYTETVREQAAASAVITERLRIARELHDLIGHSIGIIAIQAGMGNRVIDTQPAEARKALQAIELTSRDTLHGLRRMLVALRRADAGPSGTDPAPGLADVARLAATTTEAGVRVDVHWHGSPALLPPDIDL
jgi:signal transduction histidine kinase